MSPAATKKPNSPALTTIHQPRLEMGQLALSTLLERVDKHRQDPRHVVLSPRLVVRASTAPPRPERPA